MKRRISRVEISNILGAKHVCFEPGTLTVISGRNGSGKSSVLSALSRIFQKGHDSSLLRRGSKFGEILITLDDGSTIRYRVTERTTTTEITDAVGNEVAAPRSFVEELGDALAVDPARLLLAKPEELAQILLETMPVKFSQAELQEACGEECWIVANDMALEDVDTLSKQIYETRTTANRQAKEAETTAKQLKASLPPAEQTNVDWASRVSELRTLLDEARQSREGEIAVVEREEREAIEEIKARAQREIEQAHQRSKEKRTAKMQEFEPDLLKIQAALSEAEERRVNRDRAEGIRNSFDIFDKKAQTMRQSADNFTRALEELARLKQAKLANLPIPGLEVREGQVYLDGVPFQRVNLAERTKVAFQIAALRSGQLPFLVVDQAELFDPESWAAFQEAAKASGFQIIAARVSSGDLAIQTEEAAA